MAVGGARRGGAGYLQFFSPSQRVQDLVLSSYPDVVCIKSSKEIKGDAVLVGSGDSAIPVLPLTAPVVLDGKAIEIAKKLKNSIKVITPHEGEVKYLGTFRESREKTALSLAKQNQCIVVLKGPSTVVATPLGSLWIDSEGGPELATAGSGDVLAGLIVSMLASWKPKNVEEAFEVVKKSVQFHSAAGKSAAKKSNPVVATDIVEALQHIN